MFYSPKSSTTPGGLSCSTPQSSGTFSAARTKSRHEFEQNKNKENEIKPLLNYRAAVKTGGRRSSFSSGGLVEAAADHHRGGGGGDRKHGSGGAVQPGQLDAWQNQKSTEKFYGPSQASHSEWNSQIIVTQKKKKANQVKKAADKKLEAKINQRSKMNPPEPGSWDDDLIWHTGLTPPPQSRPVATDLTQDLNMTNHDDSSQKPTEEKETIDLSSPSPISPIPSLLPQQLLPSYLIGFKNYGNTCYLNACLQSLLGLDMFITDMMNITRQKLVIDESGQQGLVHSFCKLCMAYREGDGVISNEEMKMIKKVMEMLDKQFIGHNMQDASEFLSRFIDELNEDAKRLTRSLAVRKEGYENEKGVDVEEKNEVIKYFQHEKEEVLVCHGCGAEAKCRVRDMSMWCDTTSSSNMNRTRSMSLQQLLEQSLAKETRERRCEECGCEEAITTSQLVKLPKVLIIILKRYRFNNQDVSYSGKVSRQVSIPETVSLSSLVSDTVTLPDTSLPVLLPHLDTQGVSVPLPSSPGINPVVPSPPPVTPTKFKGVTEEQVASFNEQEQLEYMLFVSQKEAYANEKAGDEDVDDDLKAALEASMRDETFNQVLTLAGEASDQWADVSQESCRTPSRKRNYRQFNSDGGDVRGDHDGVNYTSGAKEEKTYSKVVEGNVSSNLYVPRPTTKEQEEEDLRRALELSTQESGFGDNAMDQMEVDDNENNNNNTMVEQDMPTTGLPEHTYQLQSVVSHHGSSASFGHYVADVFRFDGGGWHRYDDTRVTKTDGRTVRTGPNSSNGYILTYLYQPLWVEK